MDLMTAFVVGVVVGAIGGIVVGAIATYALMITIVAEAEPETDSSAIARNL